MALASPTTIRSENAGRRVIRAKGTLRAAAILTGSYVASDHFDISRFRQAIIFFNVTKASLASVEYKIEQSLDDGVTWKNIGAQSITLANIDDGVPPFQRTLSGNEEWYKVFEAIGQHIRVQIKGTGTVTASSATIEIVGRA